VVQIQQLNRPRGGNTLVVGPRQLAPIRSSLAVLTLGQQPLVSSSSVVASPTVRSFTPVMSGGAGVRSLSIVPSTSGTSRLVSLSSTPRSSLLTMNGGVVPRTLAPSLIVGQRPLSMAPRLPVIGRGGGGLLTNHRQLTMMRPQTGLGTTLSSVQLVSESVQVGLFFY